MAYVHVGHDCVIGSHCVIANRVSLAGEVHVGDWVVIGGHAAVHQWTHIGDHSMVQGGALLSQDLPPYVIVRNDTLRFAGINRVGLSRRGFTPERIAEIHEACRILFQSGLNYLNGCNEVEQHGAAEPRARQPAAIHPRIEAGHHQTLRIPHERGINFTSGFGMSDFFSIFAVSKDGRNEIRGRNVPLFRTDTRLKHKP